MNATQIFGKYGYFAHHSNGVVALILPTVWMWAWLILMRKVFEYRYNR